MCPTSPSAAGDTDLSLSGGKKGKDDVGLEILGICSSVGVLGRYSAVLGIRYM